MATGSAICVEKTSADVGTGRRQRPLAALSNARADGAARRTPGTFDTIGKCSVIDVVELGLMLGGCPGASSLTLPTYGGGRDEGGRRQAIRRKMLC